MFNLAERIKMYQKQTGFKSVTAFANEAEIPASTLYDVIKGRTKSLSAENAQKLAAFVGVSVDEVFGKEKAPDAEAPEAEILEAVSLMSKFTKEEQLHALEYLRFLASNK